MNTERTFIKNLNTGDRFRFVGQSTVMEVVSKRTMDNLTALAYRPEGHYDQWEVVKVNLTTVDRLV